MTISGLSLSKRDKRFYALLIVSFFLTSFFLFSFGNCLLTNTDNSISQNDNLYSNTDYWFNSTFQNSDNPTFEYTNATIQYVSNANVSNVYEYPIDLTDINKLNAYPNYTINQGLIYNANLSESQDNNFTSFISTKINSTTPKISDFDVNNGTIVNNGNLNLIDNNTMDFIADNSTTVSENYQYIDSIYYFYGTSGAGTIENTYLDDSNYKQINSVDLFGTHTISIRLDFDPTLNYRDFYISAHITTSSGGGNGHLKINNVDWKVSNNIDFDDELRTGVNVISFVTDGGTSHNTKIYYFQLRELTTNKIYTINFTNSLNMENLTDSNLRLQYAYKTNISLSTKFYYWNYNISDWKLLDSTNYTSFNDCFINLNNTFYNITKIVNLSIFISSNNNFTFSIDQMRIITKSYLNISIAFSFPTYSYKIYGLKFEIWYFNNISQNFGLYFYNYSLNSSIFISNLNNLTLGKYIYSNQSIYTDYINNSLITLSILANSFNEYNLSIDYFKVSLLRPFILSYKMSFSKLGYWKYRYSLDYGLPSNYTQDWINFRVILPPWLDLGVNIPWYVFLIAIFPITVIGLWYKREFITSKRQMVKFWFGLTAIDGLLFLCGVNSIGVYLTIGNNVSNSSWIFTLLNALIFGVYLNIIGYGGGNLFKRNALRTLCLFVLVVLCFSGFGFFGLLVKFNFPLNMIFFYDIFSTGTVHGIRFLSYNILLFVVILFFSFLLEREVNG